MNIWKVAEAAFILLMLVSLCYLEKKDPERARMVLANTAIWSLGAMLPLALIETLASFGIHLLDVSWAFTPLDGMSLIAMMALLVLSGKKLLGFIPAKN